jgi:hypothetical protein
MCFKNAHGCVQNAENGFGFDFLERCHEDDDEFLNEIARVTGDETGVSFVKALDAHTLIKEVENCKETSARKLKVSFHGQERRADGEIYAKRNHNHVTNVLRNTEELH